MSTDLKDLTNDELVRHIPMTFNTFPNFGDGEQKVTAQEWKAELLRRLTAGEADTARLDAAVKFIGQVRATIDFGIPGLKLSMIENQLAEYDAAMEAE